MNSVFSNSTCPTLVNIVEKHLDADMIEIVMRNEIVGNRNNKEKGTPIIVFQPAIGVFFSA